MKELIKRQAATFFKNHSEFAAKYCSKDINKWISRLENMIKNKNKVLNLIGLELKLTKKSRH